MFEKKLEILGCASCHQYQSPFFHCFEVQKGGRSGGLADIDLFNIDLFASAENKFQTVCGLIVGWLITSGSTFSLFR